MQRPNNEFHERRTCARITQTNKRVKPTRPTRGSFKIEDFNIIKIQFVVLTLAKAESVLTAQVAHVVTVRSVVPESTEYDALKKVKTNYYLL